MRYCLDVLGAAQYQSVVFNTVPKNIGLGVFAEEFGNAFPFVTQAIKKGYEFIRVQLIWDDAHLYGDKDIPKLRELCPKYQELAKQYPSVKIALSPFCEHNLAAPDKYLDLVKTLAPTCEVVNTIWKGKISTKYKNEIHGEKAKAIKTPFSFSYDGSDCIDDDIGTMQQEMQKCQEFYYWRPRFNLHKTEDDPQRNSPPDSVYMKQVVALCQDKGETELPKLNIWKPVSEKNKPVFITSIRSPRVLLKRNNKVVATLPLYGAYEGGGFRYYSKKQGYDIGKVEVHINNKKIGNINAPFRDGLYR